ncbi:Retrotransposon protein, Ty3-gypsy subclass [Phytophthora megakarya]|uniref:Retrotransposon protein, Ty3-gypsy subclass n=1 Tax=Phytophthora megakarya TaxID=4795 RepID=A0A225VDV9_9STRA|nr:Retrotransposon protein, Ty3-gypsy subclass [Phytophthora megakarya]
MLPASRPLPRFRWISGKTNIVADAISRAPQLDGDERTSHVLLASLLHQLTQVQHSVSPDEAFIAYMRQRPSFQEQCQRFYPNDPVFGPVLRHLTCRQGQEAVPVDLHPPMRLLVPDLGADDGLIYLRAHDDEARRLCIPSDVDLRNSILFECHDTAARGHPGLKKTLALAQQKYYWVNMYKTISKYVQSCEFCQRIKASQRKPAGLLHPLEIPHKRWSQISMDFMPDLVATKRAGFDTILVILDHLTKRAHFIPTFKTASAKDTAWLFLREHVRLHGSPDSIVSDRDSRFLSAFWQEVTARQGSQLRVSTAFKPSTGGQNERSHRFINDYFRAFISPRQNDWDELLPMAEFAYNAHHHCSIDMSPFEADLGYLPRAIDDLAVLDRPQPNRDALHFTAHIHAVLQRCRDSLATAQGWMKHYYDRNRPDIPITVGDQVLLDTTHLDLAHIGAQGRRKFAARFIGPYKVVAVTTPDTYKLALPPGIRLHDEFHVSYLRRYIEDTNPNRLNNECKSVRLLVIAPTAVLGNSKFAGMAATCLIRGSQSPTYIKLQGSLLSM